MNTEEARNIVNSFNEREVNSEEDIFMFTEAMNFLIEKEQNPSDMMYLGGYYYEIKNFNLALKYYEMAASYDYEPAYEGLGYIWYYGRTGEKNYEKAFEYFSKLMDRGNPVATYKVADMYKNGYFVEKDYGKYCEIVEELYTQIGKFKYTGDPVPEICTRLARIRKKEGNDIEAVNLYLKAKDWLAQRIMYSPFFGNLNIMKWLIDDLYELTYFDAEFFDLFDLYYLLKNEHEISFMYDGKEMNIMTEIEDDICHVCFNGKWFYSRDEFFRKAEVDGALLTSLYNDLYGFEVER